MADIERQRGVAAMDQHLLESTTSVAHDDDDEDGCFTFAPSSPLMAAGGEFAEGIMSPVYPVFGRPRSPPLPEQQQQKEEEDSTSAAVRVPLALLLLEERGSPSGQAPDDVGELDGVPADTYCLWSPGASPPPARSHSLAARSTGSVLRWRQRLLLLGRSNSDGKEKFVFGDADGGRDGWKDRGRDGKGGGGNGGRPSFLPDKMDLVGLVANAGAFRRSYHPF